MRLTARETAVFGMLGAVMYASKVLMEAIPNVHLLGAFTMAFTLQYGRKALYPIYVYVLLLGLLNGIPTWWLPHLYLWTVLWGVTMLLPKGLPPRRASLLYMAVCAGHGFLYGTLYAPAQALLFGLDISGMIAWIIAGLPWDAVHGVSNFFMGALVLPLVSALRTAERGRHG